MALSACALGQVPATMEELFKAHPDLRIETSSLSIRVQAKKDRLTDAGAKNADTLASTWEIANRVRAEMDRENTVTLAKPQFIPSPEAAAYLQRSQAKTDAANAVFHKALADQREMAARAEAMRAQAAASRLEAERQRMAADAKLRRTAAFTRKIIERDAAMQEEESIRMMGQLSRDMQRITQELRAIQAVR